MDFSKITNITSVEFLAFVLASLTVYYLFPSRWQNKLLLIFSWGFYFIFPTYFLFLLIGLTLFNYYYSKLLYKIESRKSIMLWVGIFINLSAILVFKHFQLYLPILNALSRLLSVKSEISFLNILLPIGLSYYVLESISYLVEVYQKKEEPINSFVLFGIYIAYFPKLLAGPIEKPREFISQLTKSRVVDNERLSRAMMQIILGVFKKLALADPLFRLIPEAVFRTPYEYGSFALTYWAMAFVLFLYADFSGYTNIVRGISELFGITLKNNFRQPIFSNSFSDAWMRWHISLTTWLRDYVYFPLTRSLLRKNQNKRNIFFSSFPIIVTLVVSGIWHNVSIEMMVWGLGIGTILSLEAISENIRIKNRLGQILNIFVLWIIGSNLSILFIVKLDVAIEYWKTLLTGWNSVIFPDIRLLYLFVTIAWIDWQQFRSQNEFIFLTMRTSVKAFLLIFIFFNLVISSQYDFVSRFVYEGF